MKKDKRAGLRNVLLVGLAAAVLFAGFMVVEYYANSGGDGQGIIIPIGTYATQQKIPPLDSDARWNLALELGDNFGLDEVQLRQEGDTLVVWFKSPTISEEQFNEGLAQSLGYLDLRVPEDIKRYRLTFIVDGVDSAYIQVDRSLIKQWRDGVIDNIHFIDTFKKIAL